MPHSEEMVTDNLEIKDRVVAVLAQAEERAGEEDKVEEKFAHRPDFPETNTFVTNTIDQTTLEEMQTEIIRLEDLPQTQDTKHQLENLKAAHAEMVIGRRIKLECYSSVNFESRRAVGITIGDTILTLRNEEGVQCLDVPGKSEPYVLKEGDNLIGTSPDNDIQIADGKISPLHTTIHLKGNKVTIENNESDTGTYVGIERMKRKDGLKSKSDLPDSYPSLHEGLDNRTGFRTKAVLLSEKGMREVNEQISGPKLYWFMDFDNMAPPNKFGLGAPVDELLESMTIIAEDVFRDMPNSLFRQGGDEFGGILPDTPEAYIKLEEFFKKLKDKQNELFGEGEIKMKPGLDRDDYMRRLSVTKRFSGMRTAMRQIRKDYLEICKDIEIKPSFSRFRSWLEEQGATLQQRMENVSHERATGLLQRSLAEKRIANDEVSAERDTMTSSVAVVRVGENPTPETMVIAVNQGDHLIHEAKRAGVSTTLEPQALEGEVNPDSIYEITEWKKRETEYALLENSLENETDVAKKTAIQKEMELLQMKDPSVRSVIRVDFVRHLSVQKVFGIEQPAEFTELHIDIASFGSINNNLGYPFADNVLAKVVDTTNKVLGPTQEIYYMRVGGGELKPYVKGAVTKEQQEAIGNGINEILRAEVMSENNPLAAFEVSEREALRDLIDAGRDEIEGKTSLQKLEREIQFDKIKVKSKVVIVSVNQSIANLLFGE